MTWAAFEPSLSICELICEIGNTSACFLRLL